MTPPDRRRRRPEDAGRADAFLKSRGLSADIVQSPNFFTTMIDAVQSPSSTGLTWCNDTPHKVMAAVATDDGKAVTSRGWYRIDPGKCLHPDVTGQPKQIFSFAEAVDAENRTINQGQAAELGRHNAALHPREQVRDQRTGRLRQPRPCPDRLCRRRHVERRQDAAICDAMMELSYLSSSSPRRPGPITTGLTFWPLTALQQRQLAPCSPMTPRRMGPGVRRDDGVERNEHLPAPSPISTPGCSISTTRCTRITSICGSRSTRGSANSSAPF